MSEISDDQPISPFLSKKLSGEQAQALKEALKKSKVSKSKFIDMAMQLLCKEYGIDYPLLDFYEPAPVLKKKRFSAK